MVPGRGVQRLAAAAAFCVVATLPLFTHDRANGLAFAVVAVGLVTLGSIGGAPMIEPVVARRALLVRNLQFASAGAVCAVLLSGILWARDLISGDAQA